MIRRLRCVDCDCEIIAKTAPPKRCGLCKRLLKRVRAKKYRARPEVKANINARARESRKRKAKICSDCGGAFYRGKRSSRCEACRPAFVARSLIEQRARDYRKGGRERRRRNYYSDAAAKTRRRREESGTHRLQNTMSRLGVDATLAAMYNIAVDTIRAIRAKERNEPVSAR